MGWIDEAYRDADNLLGKGAGAMHITGDLSLADFGTIVNDADYPKLADYLHTARGTKFIMVGEKSYAVESATASSGRYRSTVFGSLVQLAPQRVYATRSLGGRYRVPGRGKNVPGTCNISEPFCNRYWINSDAGNSYGTTAAFPSWMYPEDGNRFFPGHGRFRDQRGHVGGDIWAADAAIAMMDAEPWSGMFVTLGAIDKAAHMWGAQDDAANFHGDCNDPNLTIRGANQTHVRCAAGERRRAAR